MDNMFNCLRFMFEINDARLIFINSRLFLLPLADKSLALYVHPRLISSILGCLRISPTVSACPRQLPVVLTVESGDISLWIDRGLNESMCHRAWLRSSRSWLVYSPPWHTRTHKSCCPPVLWAWNTKYRLLVPWQRPFSRGDPLQRTMSAVQSPI